MSSDAFYSTVAAACFTLLALWWAVVQFRHADWMTDRTMRRLAFAVSLQFLVPGVMSLFALLSADAPILWRVGFAGGAASGFIAVLLLVARERGSSSVLHRRGQLLSLPLYAAVAVVAVVPTLAASVGLDLKPLQVEGVVVSLLLVLGVNLAWGMFAGAGPVAPEDRRAGP